MTAPTRAATPTGTMVFLAPLVAPPVELVVVPEPVVLAEPLDVLEPEEEPPVVEAPVVEAPVVEAPVVEASVVLEPVEDPAPEEPVLEAEPERQLSLPGFTVKTALWAMVPVLSRSWRETEVPPAMEVFQVREVPVCEPKLTRAVPDGSLPGWRLRKKGPVPPDQERRVGSHSTTLVGVLIDS